MDAHKVIEVIGTKGKFHIILGAILCVTVSSLALNNLAMIVYGYVPPHSCRSNHVVVGVQNITANPKDNSTRIEYGICEVSKHFNNTVSKSSCKNGWSFDVEERQSTIMTEWSLVCDKEYLGMLSVSIYFFGVMISGIVFGSLSDRFGRRKIIMLTMYAHTILGVGVAFAPNYISFVIMRFLLGFFIEGLPSTAFVMLIEMAPKKWRTFAAGCYEQFWPLGAIWLAGVAWLVRDWRKIQLIFALGNLYSLVYFWILPESIRWSITKGRVEEAMHYIKKIARFNKIVVPNDLNIKTPDRLTEADNRQKVSTFRRFINIMTQTKVIRKRALCMFLIWMTASFAYYGISLNVTSLSGNVYLNIFISSVIEVPATIMAAVLFRWVGRRVPVIVYYSIAGVACITAGCLPEKTSSGKSLKNYVSVLAFIGKFFVSAAFGSINIKTSELFPTSIRNTLTGCCLFCTRVGATVAPQIVLLGIYTFKELPFIIFGSFAISAAAAGLLLPETKGKPLPDTIEDVEGNSKHSFIEQLELNENYRSNDDKLGSI